MKMRRNYPYADKLVTEINMIDFSIVRADKLVNFIIHVKKKNLHLFIFVFNNTTIINELKNSGENA